MINLFYLILESIESCNFFFFQSMHCGFFYAQFYYLVYIVRNCIILSERSILSKLLNRNPSFRIEYNSISVGFKLLHLNSMLSY